MDHKGIVELVKSMEIRSLTEETFEDFVQRSNKLFFPKGARFQEYSSKGYNPASKDVYDWSKGKPEYKLEGELVFNTIELRESRAEGKRWINVHFRNITHNFNDAGIWGVDPQRIIPLKFGFVNEKALYIAEESHNGTPEHPWESLYLKLE